MTTEFKLPKLGEGTEAGQVTRLLVSVGDIVQPDQPVIELETDKATVEVPSPIGGTVKEVCVHEGDEVKEGQVILILDGGTEIAPVAAKPVEEEEKAPRREKTPAEETRPEGKPEERTKKPVEEISAVEVPKERPAETEPAGEEKEAPEEEGPAVRVPAAPSVRKFAREMGVDISRVSGSDTNGRVSVEDVKRYVRQIMKSNERPVVAGSPSAPPLPDFETWGSVRREPMSNIRRRTAEHLSFWWPQVPQVTQFDQADITTLEQERKHVSKRVEEAGGKLTITSIMAKVVSTALGLFPQFNASVDMEQKEIIYKEYHNIGIAVDTERGLLVPVLKDIDRKNLIQIATEISSLAEKARNGKIHPDDLHGGTFTITNLGSIGGTHFSPVVNSPQVAILGIGRAFQEPRFQEDAAETRVVLPLSLSYDHRAIDGADGARFLRWIVEALEQPLLLPLEG